MKKIITIFIMAVAMLSGVTSKANSPTNRQSTDIAIGTYDVVMPTFEVAMINQNNFLFESTYDIVLGGFLKFEAISSNDLQLPNRIRLNKLFIQRDRLSHGYYSYNYQKLLNNKKTYNIEPLNKRQC